MCPDSTRYTVPPCRWRQPLSGGTWAVGGRRGAEGDGGDAGAVRQLVVPGVKGDGGMIEGGTPEARAQELMRRLKETGVLNG